MENNSIREFTCNDCQEVTKVDWSKVRPDIDDGTSNIEIHEKGNGYAYYGECMNCGNLVEIEPPVPELTVDNVDVDKDGMYIQLTDTVTNRSCWIEAWQDESGEWEYDFNQYIFHLDNENDIVAKMFQEDLENYAEDVFDCVMGAIDDHEEEYNKLQENKAPTMRDRLKEVKSKFENKEVKTESLYGEWIDLLDKIPADKIEDYKAEYDLYDKQINGDEKPTEMILPKLIAGAKKYIESKEVKTESAPADVIEYFGMQDNTDETFKNNVAKEYKILRAKYPDKEMILNGDFGTYLGTEKTTPVEKGEYITVYNKVEENKKEEAKFKDKVKAIKKSLKKNDKRLSDETAEKSAERIVGSMIKKEEKTIKTENILDDVREYDVKLYDDVIELLNYYFDDMGTPEDETGDIEDIVTEIQSKFAFDHHEAVDIVDTFIKEYKAKLAGAEKTNLSKEDIKNLLDNGNIIKVGGKMGTTPTKYLEKNGKLYFLNEEITWGVFLPHPKGIDKTIDYIVNLQKDGFTVTSEDWDDTVKIEECEEVKTEDVDCDTSYDTKVTESKTADMDTVDIITELEGGELTIADVEDWNAVKSVASDLQNSQGYYGRLLRDMLEVEEEFGGVENLPFPITM